MKNKLLTIFGIVIASLLVGGYYADARISTAPSSGGISSLTPWTSNIDAATFNLSGLGLLNLNTFSSNPQIYADSDTNTGVAFPGPDIVEIETGGISRMYFNAAGDIALGSSTIPDDTVAIISNSSHPILEVYSSSSQSKFIVANNGNVGIGTVSPSQKLDVAGRVVVDNNYGYLQRTFAGANTTLLNLTSSDNLTVGQAVNVVDVNLTSGTGNLNLQTAGVTRATILAGGNVGVGTTTPDDALDVVGNIDIASSTGKLKFGDGTFQTTSERCDLSFGIEGATSTNALDLNGDSFTEPFPYNATITKVKAWNTQTGQSSVFNLSYDADATTATSTGAVFTAHKTTTSTTVSVYTPDASSTPALNDILRINFGNTSSTQFQVNVCYTPR